MESAVRRRRSGVLGVLSFAYYSKDGPKGPFLVGGELANCTLFYERHDGLIETDGDVVVLAQYT